MLIFSAVLFCQVVQQCNDGEVVDFKRDVYTGHF